MDKAQVNTPATLQGVTHKHRLAQAARRWWAVGALALTFLTFVAAPWPLLDKLFAIAYGICPQRPAHSLFFGGQQMSIEARMFGVFGGAVAAALYFVVCGRGKAIGFPQPGVWVVLMTFVAWMGLDGFNALFFDMRLPHLYTPTLILRLGTGLLAGLFIGALIVPVFNQTIWVPSARCRVPVLAKWLVSPPGCKLLCPVFCQYRPFCLSANRPVGAVGP
jgi:uncharacterized membrane protein